MSQPDHRTQARSTPPGPSSQRILAAMFGGFFIVMLLILSQSLLQQGKHTQRSAGLCGLVEAKKSALEGLKGNKLVLVGGSGTTMGLRAEQMQAALGLPVRNFGLQASLGPRLLLDTLKPELRPGDAVLLINEYYHYSYSRAESSAIEVYTACGSDMRPQLTLRQRLQLRIATSPMRWLEVLRYGNKPAQKPKHLTAYGDRGRAPDYWPAVQPAQVQRMANYKPVPIRFDQSSDGVLALRAFVQWAQAHNILVFATWPNTIAFPSYSADPGFTSIRRFYEDLSVPVIGSYGLGLYPLDQFYDTQYHLTANGITRRTDDLLFEMARAGHNDMLRAHITDQNTN